QRLDCSIHRQLFINFSNPLRTAEEKAWLISLDKLRKAVIARIEEKRVQHVISRNEYANVMITLYLASPSNGYLTNGKKGNNSKLNDDIENLRAFLSIPALSEPSSLRRFL